MSEQQDEIKLAIFKLRIEKGMTMREISKETGLSLGKVAEYLKGIPASQTEAPPPAKRPPTFMPILISKEHVAKLYGLAIDEGFEDVNDWIKNSMLPWYRVKRNFEWKLRTKLNPEEFETYIESCMLDSIELRALKEKLGKMSAPPVAPSPSLTQTTVNPPESKGVKPT